VIITNKFGLPESIVNVLKFERHKKEGYSATELLKSPRQYWLSQRHDHEIEQDVSDRIWALFGSASHYILSKGEAPNQLIEEYLTADMNGIKLSGRIDCYEKKIISDWKTTSAWTIIYKSGDERNEQQLNIYAYLVSINGFPVDAIQNICILRDWSKMKAQTDPNYPQSIIVVKQHTLWSIEQRESFINERIAMLEANKDVSDGELPECSNDDKWHSDDIWSVKKKGAKRATKNCKSQQEAELKIKELGSGYEIEFRPGENRKCKDYCECRLFCKYR
jgi:hypothetical protein